MNNVVLYRKYRPQKFGEVVGQEHVVQTLCNSILANNISHAYLFSGPRGSGKTTLARLFAKTINCQNREKQEPCNKCSSCLEITENKAIDLIEIDAASHTGVDAMRDLIEGVKFSPTKSKYKVFIIDECHQLSKSAANALLKTLEEPPPHAVFILATTEAHKMIATIVSRCQRFDFRRLQNSEIIKKLEFIAKKESIKFDNSALNLIALNARGSFRDAESLFDQCVSFTSPAEASAKAGGKVVKIEDIKALLGVVEAEKIAQFVDLLISKNTKDSLVSLDALANKGVDLQEFTKTLIFYLRQALLSKIGDSSNMQNSGLSNEELAKLKTQTESLSVKEIQNMLEIFIAAEGKIKYASVDQLPLELAVINITHQEA